MSSGNVELRPVSSFFSELKRRKVYRVAAAYVVVGYAIIELADITFGAYELPAWAIRLVIALVLFGFPVALIFAWIFDLTPAGVQPTAPIVAPGEARPRRTRRNIAILLSLGIAISAGAGWFLLPRASAERIEKSIAVLPFENLSADQENTYFADGVQEDILTSLSKISDLKVISRTSVMGYRGGNHNIRQIGRDLAVGYVLEGSVRRVGDKVRVNAQLINAATDEHVWAEVYERDLTDVFAIQSELAQRIASELRAKLSPEEKEQMTRRPTENGEAYLAFIEAQNLHAAVQDPQRLRQAEQLYRRAIELDPQFALATAKLSHLHSWMFQSHDKTPARREQARELAERALKLQPDLPETHLALGYYYYYGERDYDRALEQFAIAKRGLPNNSQVYVATAAIQRRQGKWAESTANFERAVELNPKDAWTLQNLGMSYQRMRQFDAAERTFRRALEIAPDVVPLQLLLARLPALARGDVAASEAVLNSLPENARNRSEVQMAFAQLRVLQRRFAEALQLLDTAAANHPPDQMLKHDVPLMRAMVLHFAGSPEARQAFENARAEFEQKVREFPENAALQACLGEVLAHLGERDAAVAAIARAQQLLPESVDAMDGPMITALVMQAYIALGDNDRALQLLDHLLTVPSDVTVPLVRLDPVADPLRSDPRLEQILAKHARR
jgi:TolB-like protein/Tfp pilus assembly protein PilF